MLSAGDEGIPVIRYDQHYLDKSKLNGSSGYYRSRNPDLP